MPAIPIKSIHCAFLSTLILICCAASGDETPRDRAWKVLTDAAKDKSADRRADAVSALGLIPADGESVSVAEKALQDPANQVRDAGVTALGEMGARNSVEKIKALLRTGDAHTVVTIAAVLRKFNDPEGYEIYYEILTGKRKGSGGILAGIKDKKALEKMGIEEALGFVPYASIGIGAYNYIKANTSSTLDAAAATELATDPDPVVRKALVDAAYNGKDVVKVAALRALAKRGDPTVVKDIAPEMYSEKPLVSYTAAAAIVRLTDRAGKRKIHGAA